MSSYLRFFELERAPFEGEGRSQVVLGTRAVRDALETIRKGLDEGVARICVSGGAGMGKTSLARALPKLLGDEARVAVVLDPGVPWNTLRPAIARQWGREDGLARAGLIEASRERRLVLVLDQAEQASAEFLDHLDVILSYRSERDEPVVQSVLLANLGTEPGAEPAPLVWWLDRIQTLQLEFAPLSKDGVAPYIQKHLKRVGWRGERLFTPAAAEAIHGYSGGIPGRVGRLCEQLLAAAAAHDLQQIDADFVQTCCDTEAGDETDEITLEDVVEDLVVENGVPDVAPALSETLEHFADTSTASASEQAHASRDAAPASDAHAIETQEETTVALDAESGERDETDAAEVPEPPASEPASGSFDAYLSRPPTPEELRALNGGFVAQYARSVVGLAVAVLVLVGLVFAYLHEPVADGSAMDPRTEASAIGRDAPGWNATTARPPTAEVILPSGQPAVLARIRGPVVSADPDGPPPAAAVAPVVNGPSVPTAAATSEPRPGNPASEAPAAPAPTVSDPPRASGGLHSDERFW